MLSQLKSSVSTREVLAIPKGISGTPLRAIPAFNRSPRPRCFSVKAIQSEKVLKIVFQYLCINCFIALLRIMIYMVLIYSNMLLSGVIKCLLKRSSILVLVDLSINLKSKINEVINVDLIISIDGKSQSTLSQILIQICPNLTFMRLILKNVT